MPESQGALLDTKSSSVQNPLRPTYRETMLQSCEDELLEAEYIYGHFDQRDTTFKITRLLSCRTGAFFYRNRDTGQVRIGAQSCHLRFCPLCSKSRVLIIKANTTAWLKSALYPKLLTFTLKHSEDPLSEQLDKLYKSFREIRRLAIMKNKCSGGVWFFQVKKSKTDRMWHPHIHCLVAGSYIHQSKLAQAWFKITGDSKVVDVRSVKCVETAARHVSRYAAKPCTLKNLTLNEIIILAEAMESRRLCGTWGVCRKLKLTSSPKIDKEAWYRIASWSAVFENREYDESARVILQAWRTGGVVAQGVNLDHLYRDKIPDTEISERGSPTIETQCYFEWKGSS